MWLNRRLYEALPFVYMAIGAGWLAAGLLVASGRWPAVFLALGLAFVTGGLVVWLKRRDYRSSRSRAAFDETR